MESNSSIPFRITTYCKLRGHIQILLHNIYKQHENFRFREDINTRKRCEVDEDYFVLKRSKCDKKMMLVFEPLNFLRPKMKFH